MVTIVVIVIIIAYYNIALAIRGHAPFKVCEFLPQILFPLNLQVMFLVSLKFDPIAITLVPPVIGPYLGFESKRNGGR